VVILEDDPAVAGLLSEILSSEGFEPLSADQHTPLETVARHHPRLLLLDLLLGNKSGGEVLSALRHAGLAHVPVVLLSGKQEMEQHMRDLGAVAFVRKPFDIDELVATCRSAAL
jgi:two-component system, OmpR family, response regulator